MVKSVTQAGGTFLITQSTINKGKIMTIYNEIQTMIDSNQYVSGQADASNTIETDKYVLYCSPAGIKHILDRHADKYAPGSLMVDGIDLLAIIKDLVQTEADEIDSRGMVKWLERDAGSVVGYMGVSKGDPAEVAKMRDYSMQGYQGIEKVKIAPGDRSATNLISLITAKIGEIPDGRTVLSLVTLFPGTNTIDGVEIPHSRPDFASSGFYFTLPEDHASFKQ